MHSSSPAAIEAYDLAWRSSIRIARAIVFGALIMILARLWDIPLFGDRSGDPFSGLMFKGLLILAAGYVGVEITGLLINRKLVDETPEAEGDNVHEADVVQVGGPSASRLSTVLPSIRFTLQAGIIVLTVLTALSHIGVNVTALIAGAGVIGIAVGFGPSCSIPDDDISPRRSGLFVARSALREVRDGVRPC